MFLSSQQTIPSNTYLEFTTNPQGGYVQSEFNQSCTSVSNYTSNSNVTTTVRPLHTGITTLTFPCDSQEQTTVQGTVVLHGTHRTLINGQFLSRNRDSQGKLSLSYSGVSSIQTQPQVSTLQITGEIFEDVRSVTTAGGLRGTSSVQRELSSGRVLTTFEHLPSNNNNHGMVSSSIEVRKNHPGTQAHTMSFEPGFLVSRSVNVDSERFIVVNGSSITRTGVVGTTQNGNVFRAQSHEEIIHGP